MAASYRDMWQMTKLVLNPMNLLFLVWNTIRFKRADKIRWPEDFCLEEGEG